MHGCMGAEIADRILADIYYSPLWMTKPNIFPNLRASRNLFLNLKYNIFRKKKIRKNKMLVLLSYFYIGKHLSITPPSIPSYNSSCMQPQGCLRGRIPPRLVACRSPPPICTCSYESELTRRPRLAVSMFTHVYACMFSCIHSLSSLHMCVHLELLRHFASLNIAPSLSSAAVSLAEGCCSSNGLTRW